MSSYTFIEVLANGGTCLLSISSIAMVEPNHQGATIVMKETNKDGKSYVIITGTPYLSIKAELQSKRV